MAITEYVVGFLFDPERRDVLLIEKNRPHWQKGRWNGIGGHVEPGETPLTAMYREGLEEAGLNRPFHLPNHPVHWQQFVDLRTDTSRVVVFRAFSLAINSYEQRTDETVARWSLETAFKYPKRLVTNASWLIPMALSMDQDRAAAFTIQEQYSVLTVVDPFLSI